jgi:competence protein ComEC
VLARLADRDVTTYWTGVHDTVVFVNDDERAVVRTRREAPTDPLDLRSAPGVEPGAEGPLERRGSSAVGGSSGVVGSAGHGDGRSEVTPTETVATDGGRETAQSSQSASLVVAEVHADARGVEDENLNDEYVVFRNAGDRSLDLSGWAVGDEADHTYAFPAGTELGPGETLTLHTGSGTDGDGHYYWGAGGAIWNNGGDTVFVRTAEGELVTEETYDS